MRLDLEQKPGRVLTAWSQSSLAECWCRMPVQHTCNVVHCNAQDRPPPVAAFHPTCAEALSSTSEASACSSSSPHLHHLARGRRTAVTPPPAGSLTRLPKLRPCSSGYLDCNILRCQTDCQLDTPAGLDGGARFLTSSLPKPGHGRHPQLSRALGWQTGQRSPHYVGSQPGHCISHPHAGRLSRAGQLLTA